MIVSGEPEYVSELEDDTGAVDPCLATRSAESGAWLPEFEFSHSSVLAWRIPGTGEPGGLLSMGSQSQTRLK